MFSKLKESLYPSKPADIGPVEFIIAGLGNPEAKYDKTRHNTGFMIIDRIAEKVNCPMDRLKYKSMCGTAEIEGKRVLLMKPTTYMNLSGQAVQEAMQFYKIPAEKVLVIYDDISLDVGKMRIRRKGSDGGHNGIKNIIYLTGSDQFPRVKIGVGAKPHPDYDLAKWVLSRFSADEKKAIDGVLDHAADMAELILSGRMDEAMNVYNGK